ncbi:recombinase [Rhodococcus hoagii]|nr:recombinase [Prescottella equi]MBM4646575.1 recombinase [Prescottella equi]
MEQTIVTTSSLGELTKALVAAQKEFTAIPKDSANPFFKSNYAALPDVVKAANPIITKQGLAITQHISFDGEHDLLTTWLLHESGESIRSTMRLHLPKQDPQGQGSATTYARRYSYMAILGLVADEDDDGNAASQGQERVASSRAQASSGRPPTDKQIEMIRYLAAGNGKDDAWIDATIKEKATTSSDASKLIDWLKGDS